MAWPGSAGPGESPRSTFYFRKGKDRRNPFTPPKKREPKGAYSDEELVGKIRETLEESP